MSENAEQPLLVQTQYGQPAAEPAPAPSSAAKVEKTAQTISQMVAVVLVVALLSAGGAWAWENRETFSKNPLDAWAGLFFPKDVFQPPTPGYFNAPPVYTPPPALNYDFSRQNNWMQNRQQRWAR